MKNKSAFTLLEVVISLTISAFIMVAMIGLFRNSVSYLARTKVSFNYDSEIFLLSDQLEKDLSASFIQNLNKIEEPEKKSGDNKTEVKKEEKKTKKQDSFSGLINEGNTLKFKGKKLELLKSLSFMTSNAFLVYNQKILRFVRVKYDLVKDKANSNSQRDVYNLYRLETNDPENFDFKNPEDDKDKKNYVSKMLIAKNLKFFSFKFLTTKEGDVKDSKKEREEISSFVWPLKKDSKDKEKEKSEFTPQKIEVTCIFWDKNFEKTKDFSFLIPVILSSKITTTGGKT